METAASSSGPSGPASSFSSPPRREPLGRPKPTKSNSSKSTKTPVATRSSVLAPLAAHLGLQTPTAASIAKGVADPAPKQAPLGGINPRMPSHMTEEGRRGPPPRRNSTLGTEEGRPASAASVAAPGYDLPSPAGDNTALPGMSASPPLVSFSGNAQHSSTEPSEESDLGPYSTGNEMEPGGVGNNESITTALRFTEHSEDRVFSGLARSLEVFGEPLMTSVARYHESYFPEDPNREDPLAEFGPVGGEIPNFDPARAAALRDALIRYDKPHCQFEWEHLGQLLDEVAKIEAQTVPCFQFTDPTISRLFFCLSLEPLSRVVHAVVAVHQILEALTIFLGKDPKTSFTLDPDYGLLGLLECSEYEVKLRFTLSCLQRRLANGNKHILT
ncbi:hypothetical protein DFH08DRAFT_978395 [Mycena albidolilacea]|uniref:Uncharacterized protein n=1 Tax=Mycena albidolilacea TaxID=1033008 RepID=A0AAD6YYN9_9AGAR|nr:hypothetical protein DFH08DRAFT_978395 [Mycena albidolilacea]